VPPEKRVIAEGGMRDCQTWALRVREKSLTQPFPTIEKSTERGLLEETKSHVGLVTRSVRMTIEGHHQLAA
jgi:hypothetical protein